MFGTLLKSAATVALTGAAAFTGVALTRDAYVYARRKLVGKSESSSSSRKRSKKKTAKKAVKTKARRRPAAKPTSAKKKAA